MIYLDYQGTTPLAPDVISAMTEALPRFGNPHSAHAIGRQAAADVALARDRVLAALDMPAGQLVFTSGATEALNLAILGTARSAPIGRRRVITVATEHAAVLDTVRYLRHEGFDPVVLPVDRDGLIDLDIAAAAIDERAALLVVMQVNNEIGTRQPYDALVAIARDAGVPVICDAAQSFGRLPMPAGVDMIAMSAHKIHGPKGIGALWLRHGICLPPLMFGGGQQEGMRPGTLSPLLCVGFGVAAELAGRRREADLAHVEALWAHAGELFEGWQLNGPLDPAQRYHGNLSLRRDRLDTARLLSDCRTVAVSLGSACASGSGLPSHVLRAIGLNEAEARSTLRIGFGRYTTMAELEQAAGLLNKAVALQTAVPA
jgi:cysteine desulfurase